MSEVGPLENSLFEFKRCSVCSHLWRSREGFLSDPSVRFLGYQADLSQTELGLFVFLHDSCGTSMGIKADEFTDLYDGPVFSEPSSGSHEAAQYFLDENDLLPLVTDPAHSYVRDTIQTILGWEKS